MSASSAIGVAPSTPRARGAELAPLIRSGVELVTLTESFYRRLFRLTLQIGAGASLAVAAVGIGAWEQERLYRGLAVTCFLLAVFAAAIHNSDRLYELIRRNPATLFAGVAIFGIAYAADGAVSSGVYFPALTIVALAAMSTGRAYTLGVAAALAVVEALAFFVNGYSPGELYRQDQLAQACGAVGGCIAWGLAFPIFVERMSGFIVRLSHVGANSVREPAPDREDIQASAPADPSPSGVDRLSARLPTLWRYRNGEPQRRGAVHDQSNRLTTRQLEVVALLRDGHRANEISALLGISVRSVYQHVDRAKARTGAQTRDELIAVVVASNLLPPAPHLSTA